MKIPPQTFGYFLVIFSAVFMGLGEGKIIGLEFKYSLSRLIPVLAIYVIGVTAYLGGLLILANRIGSVIGIWEAVAIGLSIFTAVRELSKKGEKFVLSSEMLIWGLLLALGVLLVIVAGDKFISFFWEE